MGLPGVVPGGKGSTGVGGSRFYDAAETTTYKPIGVFAPFPGSTLKYALNDGTQRDNEYRETMARLFIQMTAQERKQFVRSCPPETRPLARVLAGVGTGGSGGTGFIDFLLTQVQENFQEKVQVVESLSDNFIIYTFGQKAPVFQYGGVLLNTYQDDQRVWMLRLYRDVLRATQLARRKKLVRIRYDSVIVTGVMISHGQSLNSQIQMKADFSFQFIPTQYVIYTPGIGIPTELNTPFTEGGQYGIASAKAPDIRRLRVAKATHASIAAKKPAATAKAETNRTAARLSKKQRTKVKEVMAKRAKKKSTATTDKNVRGGKAK